MAWGQTLSGLNVVVPERPQGGSSGGSKFSFSPLGFCLKQKSTIAFYFPGTEEALLILTPPGTEVWGKRGCEQYGGGGFWLSQAHSPSSARPENRYSQEDRMGLGRG